MGSWNGTCAISNLPIKDGEKAVLFPIIKNTRATCNGGGYTYSNNQFKPFGLPLLGEYNEQGCISNIEEDKYFVSYFNEMLKRKKIELNNEEKELPQTLEKLVKFIERGNIKNVGFMLVHEALYYNALSEISVRREYSGDMNFKDDVLQSAKKYFVERKASERYMFEYDEYSFSRFFYKNNMTYLLEEVAIESDEDTEYNEDYREGSNTLFTSMVNMYLFDNFLEAARKSWTLQAGTGSDAADYNIHKLIANYILYKETKEKFQHREDNVTDFEYYNDCTKSN